jgi:hypothetical protein
VPCMAYSPTLRDTGIWLDVLTWQCSYMGRRTESLSPTVTTTLLVVSILGIPKFDD